MNGSHTIHTRSMSIATTLGLPEPFRSLSVNLGPQFFSAIGDGLMLLATASDPEV